MNLLIALVIRGIVGWLASIVMKSNAQMGLIANVIVGGDANGSPALSAKREAAQRTHYWLTHIDEFEPVE